MSESQNGLIYPTEIQIENERIVVDHQVGRSGSLPRQATYLQAILEEYFNNLSSYSPKNISFVLNMLPAGTKGSNKIAENIVHQLCLPVAKQIRRETFGLQSKTISQRLMLGDSYGGFGFVRPAHFLGYTRPDLANYDYTLVGNAPLNRQTLTQKEIDKLNDPLLAQKQKIGLFLAGLLSSRPYTVDAGEYRKHILLNTDLDYLPPDIPGYEEIFHTLDGTTNLNIEGYRGTTWQEAGIGDDIDPSNHHGFELGLSNAVSRIFPYSLSETSLIFAAGVSYLDSSGASNTHPNLSPDRWHYNMGWLMLDECPVVTSLYSVPTPNLPVHFAFLDALRNSEFIL